MLINPVDHTELAELHAGLLLDALESPDGKVTFGMRDSDGTRQGGMPVVVVASLDTNEAPASGHNLGNDDFTFHIASCSW